jgi:hypothetical protein
VRGYSGLIAKGGLHATPDELSSLLQAAAKLPRTFSGEAGTEQLRVPTKLAMALFDASDSGPATQSSSGASVDGPAFHGHRQGVLEWLAASYECVEGACPPGLAALSALSLRHVHGGQLEGVLSAWDKQHAAGRPECVSLVKAISALPGHAKDKQAVLRVALVWLSRRFPRESARIYPDLLKGKIPLHDDLRAGLRLCEQHKLQCPPWPAEIITSGVAILVESPLEGARMQACRVAGQHEGAYPAHAHAFKKLLEDPSAAVRAALHASTWNDDAKKQWESLGKKSM